VSHTLTIRLEAELAARLEKAAARARLPVSTLVRELVSDWLARSGGRRANTLLAAAGTSKGRGISATNENVRASFRQRSR
jgi:predicted transcriptional regulator